MVADLRRRRDEREHRGAVAAIVEPAEPIEPAALDLTSKISSTEVSANRRPLRWRSRLAVAVGIAVVAGSALAVTRAARTSDPADASLDPNRVVVADFDNLTGDSSFNLLGASLADWVTHGITQTGVARVIDPASRVAVGRLAAETAMLRGKERAFAVARAARAGLVVSGSVVRRHDSLAIRAQITDVVNDRVVASVDPIAAPLTDPLQSAGPLRDRISGALAVTLDSRLTSITLPSSRPPTFAAYQEYILGLEAFVRVDETLALPHFARAAQLDTTFGLPLIWAGHVLENAGRRREFDSVGALLARRRAFLGPLETLALQLHEARSAEDSLVLKERGARMSPGSTWSHRLGYDLFFRNRVREAIRYFRDVDPEHGWVRTWAVYWVTYARALHAVGDYRGELSLARRYVALAPDENWSRVLEIRALASLGNLTETRRRLGDLLGQTDSDCAATAYPRDQLALELFTHGDSAGARAVYQRMLNMCRRDDERLAAFGAVKDSVAARAGARAWSGVALYRLRRYDEAKRTLAWAIAQPGADVTAPLEAWMFLGRIAARQGDRAGIERAMRAFPLDPAEPEPYVTIEYAAIATLLGDRARAMQRLEAAAEVAPFPFYRLHLDPDFDTLRGYPPFDALIAPK
jgi:tetratricopeptide (TPR) repeat protein/TolB-like protein